MSVIFCSIDASLSCTGICLLREIEDGKFELVDKTSLSTAKTKFPTSFHKKLAVEEMFQFYMKDKIQNIAFFVFENYSYGSNGKIADLAELNGLLKKYIVSNNKPFDVIPPATVKKQVANYGKASKEEVADALKNFIVNIDGITFNNTDESDACAIGVAYGLIMRRHINESEKH